MTDIEIVTPQNVLEALRRLRAKIAQGWCQDTLARDEYGAPADPVSGDAVCWCLTGGLDAVTRCATPRFMHPDPHEATCRVLGFPGEISLQEWNDAAHRTKEEVLERIDLAIEQLRVAILAGTADVSAVAVFHEGAL